MTKRDLVVASTRHHLARLLKYYPRRQRAPSLIKSRFFTHTTNLLSYILKFLICIHAGTPRVPPRVLASGPKPCGGNKKTDSNMKCDEHCVKSLWQTQQTPGVSGSEKFQQINVSQSGIGLQFPASSTKSIKNPQQIYFGVDLPGRFCKNKNNYQPVRK